MLTVPRSPLALADLFSNNQSLSRGESGSHMAKSGHLYVPLDVNWYDEWGYAVSHDAALLWVLAIGAAKRMKGSDGILTKQQLRRCAPINMTDETFEEALRELDHSTIAPISYDENRIVLRGWSAWNDPRDSSIAGEYGNHVRWHVNTQKPSPDCVHCVSPPDRTAISGGDRYRVEKSRVNNTTRESPKKPKSTRPDAVEEDFNECWKIYPRKLAKARALKAYRARRNEGTAAKDLLTATQNYTKLRDGEDPTYTMHGSTFYGPDARWEDFLKIPEKESSTGGSDLWVSRHLGAGPMFANEAEREADYAKHLGDVVVLPGERAGD